MRYLHFSRCLMRSSLLPLALLVISPIIWADDITSSFQQTKQQRVDIQQQNQQRWLSQHRFQAQHANEEKVGFSSVCLPYRGIQFRGVSLIDLHHITPKTGECITEERLNLLSRQLTAAYLEKGYLNNPFQLHEQAGFIVVQVSEGKLAALESHDTALKLAQFLPNSLGKPLKVQDLDQALDQANRVTGNHVMVDVLPAQNGEIKLVFSNSKQSPVSGMLSVDNSASKTYGRMQTRASVNIGNPFGLSDTLYFSASHTLKSRHQFNRSALLYYSVPYGYWTFNGFASLSQFKTPLALQSISLQQKGRTFQGGFSGDYVVHRSANHISTLSMQFEQVDSKNRLEDVVLELQSPKLITASLGINHLQLFERANLVADLRYEQGKNRAENQPATHFDRWNAELRFTSYPQIGNQNFRFTHQLTGQYSDDYLPAIKQEDLTGKYRVRGINDLNASAEKSLVLQNNFAWLKQTFLGDISPYIGVDIGVQKSVQEETNNEKAWAYAVGVNWNDTAWQSQLEWARGYFYQKSRPMTQENLVSFNLGYKF